MSSRLTGDIGDILEERNPRLCRLHCPLCARLFAASAADREARLRRIAVRHRQAESHPPTANPDCDT
jgi:hypothetical protein